VRCLHEAVVLSTVDNFQGVIRTRHTPHFTAFNLT
jgi:hypothetical protein